jgi:hypothetical protein
LGSPFIGWFINHRKEDGQDDFGKRVMRIGFGSVLEGELQIADAIGGNEVSYLRTASIRGFFHSYH